MQFSFFLFFSLLFHWFFRCCTLLYLNSCFILVFWFLFILLCVVVAVVEHNWTERRQKKPIEKNKIENIPFWVVTMLQKLYSHIFLHFSHYFVFVSTEVKRKEKKEKKNKNTENNFQFSYRFIQIIELIVCFHGLRVSVHIRTVNSLSSFA